jgi:hypothetical protein
MRALILVLEAAVEAVPSRLAEMVLAELLL